MTVRSIIGGGVRMVRTQPWIVAIWAAVYLAVFAVMIALFAPFMATMAQFQREAATNAALGIQVAPTLPPGFVGAILLFDLILALLTAVAFAAVVRAVARPTGDRFAYLRLGMDELRLIGLGVVFVIAALVAEIVAVLAVLLVAGLVGAVAGRGGAAVVVGLLALGLIGAAIWVQVRLSLAGALTVLRGRIVIGDAWRATRGRFWTLLGAYLLLFLAFLAVTIVLTALLNPHLMSAYASQNMAAIQAASAEQLERQTAGLSAALIGQMIVGSVMGVVLGAVAGGAVATAALESDPAPGSATTY